MEATARRLQPWCWDCPSHVMRCVVDRRFHLALQSGRGSRRTPSGDHVNVVTVSSRAYVKSAVFGFKGPFELLAALCTVKSQTTILIYWRSDDDLGALWHIRANRTVNAIRCVCGEQGEAVES